MQTFAATMTSRQYGSVTGYVTAPSRDVVFGNPGVAASLLEGMRQLKGLPETVFENFPFLNSAQCSPAEFMADPRSEEMNVLWGANDLGLSIHLAAADPFDIGRLNEGLDAPVDQEATLTLAVIDGTWIPHTPPLVAEKIERLGMSAEEYITSTRSLFHPVAILINGYPTVAELCHAIGTDDDAVNYDDGDDCKPDRYNTLTFDPSYYDCD